MDRIRNGRIVKDNGLIACQQCATAKAGCNKDPEQCSRCKAKGYVCQVRLRNVRGNGSKKTTINDKAAKARYNCEATKSRFHETSHIPRHVSTPFPTSSPSSNYNSTPMHDSPQLAWTGQYSQQSDAQIGSLGMRQEYGYQVGTFDVGREPEPYPSNQQDLASSWISQGSWPMESSPTTPSDAFPAYYNYGLQHTPVTMNVRLEGQGQPGVYDEALRAQGGIYEGHNTSPPPDYTMEYGNNQNIQMNGAYQDLTGFDQGQCGTYIELDTPLFDTHTLGSTPLSTSSSFGTTFAGTTASPGSTPELYHPHNFFDQNWQHPSTVYSQFPTPLSSSEEAAGADDTQMYQPMDSISRLASAMKGLHALHGLVPIPSCRLPVSLRIDDHMRSQLTCTLQKMAHTITNRKRLQGLFSYDNSGLILPPLDVLSHLLDGYMANFELYYHIQPSEIINTGENVADENDAASLFLLCMTVGALASNASNVDTIGLVDGIVEACRTALFETRSTYSCDLTRLRAVFLFLSLAAWGADKQQRKYARGQHEIYLNSLHRTGRLGKGQFDYATESLTDVESAYRRWREHESNNRLVYSWIALDQELNMFHEIPTTNGKPPGMGIHDINAALPLSDEFWNATTPEEWATHISGRPHSVHSLHSLYIQFKRNGLSQEGLTPLHLRLLLYPLHQQVQSLLETIDPLKTRPKSLGDNLTSLQAQRRFLSQWYDHAQNLLQSLHRQDLCDAVHASEIMYHLITIKTIARFADAKRLASGEIHVEQFMQTFCIFPEKLMALYYHSGQVLRISRTIQPQYRPLWLSEAVYRAGLVLWAASIYTSRAQNPIIRTAMTDEPIYLNVLRPGSAQASAYEKFWLHGEGLQKGAPMLQVDDGTSSITVDDPARIVSYCANLVSSSCGPGSRRIGKDLMALAVMHF
ncbi:hypothetical protein EJ05DRAFT_294156 [Pseudovirgaria hyperparasitica]|uniref:Zn(2)-C6 fungal-type domain-containing protein n=1 Tax=Pseudovirgaria hyperparasitica TaxID=470096 RepID=A0A6A6WF66_9PEZI|nr:uncharacterized protein EJ05DRAFT_294156 [Pseudovirgaria hyperparasitica]KAF2760674.1 hypothetical protein EJ05DRAFT_294156 [Pseudovirgaria hyperparasitica]